MNEVSAGAEGLEFGECRGDSECAALVHVHGCYTPHRADQCDGPNEHGHLPALTTAAARPDLDALISDLRTDPRELGLILQETMVEAAAAIAAERKRADRAESKVTSALEVAAVWIDSESSEPAPISVVTAGQVFHGLLTSEATA